MPTCCLKTQPRFPAQGAKYLVILGRFGVFQNRPSLAVYTKGTYQFIVSQGLALMDD